MVSERRCLQGYDGDLLTELYAPHEIQARVRDVADRLIARFRNERLRAVCVLRGAFMFFTDLVRFLQPLDVSVDFIGLSSYGDCRTSSGQVDVTGWFSLDVEDVNLLIVEDIVDSGRSMQMLMQKLKGLPLKSCTLCTLIDKKVNRCCEVNVDYACFSVDAGFLVGYGLDYAQKYRHLPGIFELTSAN